MNDVHYNFKGRVAVVTGGSNGIGAAIVEKLQQAGANVVNWDLQAPRAAASSHQADYCQVDISDLASIEQALATTMEQHGQIDFLVNNAGYAGPTVPVIDYDPDDWQAIIDVNLVGVFRVCRAVAPAMKQQNFGRIINMASLAGKEGTPNASAYSAAKAGVIAFTKSFGKELALSDVRVNCIAPAVVNTAILDQMAPEHVQTMIDKSPMQRLGEVDEVAELVLWLCSKACTFNSGAVFDLSGGRATY